MQISTWGAPMKINGNQALTAGVGFLVGMVAWYYIQKYLP